MSMSTTAKAATSKGALSDSIAKLGSYLARVQQSGLKYIPGSKHADASWGNRPDHARAAHRRAL